MESYKQAEVDVVELKKINFKEMQHQKGQMMTELKKMKEKWESMKDAHSRVSSSYQQIVNERRERGNGSIILPPPPPSETVPRKRGDPQVKQKLTRLTV